MIRPIVFDTEDKADFQPSLLLERGGEHPAAIFTPHMIYKAKREYVIEKDSGEIIRVYAKKLLETTRSFERFEYQIIKLHG